MSQKKWQPGFSLFEGSVERENDYALIISLDSVNSLAFVEAYTLYYPQTPPLSLVFIYLHVTFQIPNH
jgi:hypothetical protein